MKMIALNDWASFKRKLDSLDRCLKKRQARGNSSVSNWLFRGESNACWKLKTTLERQPGHEEMAVEDYLRRICSIRSRIQAFTRYVWTLPDEVAALQEQFEAGLDQRKPMPLAAYEYMAYLRHHGFPSPLLDWTRSPFIAAYFAFQRASHSVSPSVKRVSIYAYLEGSAATLLDEPHIHSLGHTIHAHARHFLQQSEYTFCCRKKKKPDAKITWFFTSHEQIRLHNESYQDILLKFTIPASERRRALAELDRFNISGYSLSGSEDSLSETLGIQEFVIRQ